MELVFRKTPVSKRMERVSTGKARLCASGRASRRDGVTSMMEETARIEASSTRGWGQARSARRGRWLALGLRALVALAVACLGIGGALLTQTRISLAADPQALGQLRLARLGGELVRVTAQTAAGTSVPLRLDGRSLLPRGLVAPGTRITLTAVVRRPRAFSWLLGREQTLRLTLVAPAPRLRERWLHLEPGAPLRLSFNRPVVKALVRAQTGTHTLVFARPRRSITLASWAGDAAGAGSVWVAAVSRSWERLPRPVQVSWFPRGAEPRVLISPTPGRLLPRSTIKLTFSKTTRSLLGDRLPRLAPAPPGRWLRTSSHGLAFVPAGAGFPLASHVRLVLPVPLATRPHASSGTRTVGWSVPPGSTLRLQQLLAQLGYLPLTWTPERASPSTPAIEATLALAPPDGSFSWRYRRLPASLRRLWQPGQPNLLTTGALMSFEDAHGLAPDGQASADVWRALIADAVAGKRHTGGYSYVTVHQTVPQRLVLWHNGKVTTTAAANTGIAVAPTPNGTWPVYLRFRSATMSGTNPDGTHYDDPGVPWISYFHGGDAIHGFPRSSYGVPQSLGCVELSYGDAARVWPLTPVGTLVTVEP
jgi:lipoprotein-anchoring transpeptidase ErfK/SrfK